MAPHLAAKVSGAWDRGRVARSTSPEAGFRSLQVGVANSAGTAGVALFSYSLPTSRVVALPTGEAACTAQEPSTSS